MATENDIPHLFATPPDDHRPRRRTGLILTVVALGVIAAGALWYRWTSPNPSAAADSTAPPTVGVVKVTRRDLYNTVTIPGEFRAYWDVPIHAKVSGIVTNMAVDYGDLVKQGQVLATLYDPELTAEYTLALAAERTAREKVREERAAYDEANEIYTNLAAVIKAQPGLVAQIEVDKAADRSRNTSAALAAAQQQVSEAEANAAKLQALCTYTNIVSPFKGVVTERYVDSGQLIQVGTTTETQSLPVFRISDNYLLRLEIPVSVGYVKDIHLGDRVEVRVDSLGGKTYTGTIARFTRRVDMATRTMITEVDVENPHLELVPGMYAWVVLHVQPRLQALTVPTVAVAAVGDQGTVYVVNAARKVEQRIVKLGLEVPNRWEIVSGLNEGDEVVVGHPAELQPGEAVSVTNSVALTELNQP
ncbi:MAG: efflux RND transporter periplasmic adaptor subunit [Verrucomicrobia bacterium]|nr:efflux RND transporter periplasmic adaptor subunit [Verrucomicrobiota bacterium]